MNNVPVHVNETTNMATIKKAISFANRRTPSIKTDPFRNLVKDFRQHLLENLKASGIPSVRFLKPFSIIKAKQEGGKLLRRTFDSTLEIEQRIKNK